MVNGRKADCNPQESGRSPPIAIGEILRRLAAAALLRGSMEQLPPLPRQFILRRDGCAAIASLVRASITTNPACCALVIDLRNAFNTVNRSTVMTAVSGTILSSYAQWAYGSASILRFGEHSLLSCSGVQQGDPAGPALFAMALSEALRDCRNNFGEEVLDLWYADDGILLGNHTAVLDAFNSLYKPLETIGLIVNNTKCKLWNQGEGTSSTSNIEATSFSSANSPLVVLGFPVMGSQNAFVGFSKAAVAKASNAIQPLLKLHHVQGEASILRSCGPTTRLKHLLRIAQTTEFLDNLYDADNETLAQLARIIGRPPPAGWEAIASSPINAGGLGFQTLRSLDHRSECSRALASIEGTVKEAALTDDLEGLNTNCLLGPLEWACKYPLPPERPKVHPQTPFLSEEHRLIQDSFAAPHTCAFLLSFPGPATKMSNSEFRDALWFRLALPCAVGHSGCDPSPQADKIGLHRLGCSKAGGARIRRHDDLVSVVASAALAADPNAFQVAREQHLPDDTVSQARPGDVALNLGNGRSFVDLTVANPFASARVANSRSAGSPAAAAASAYDRKLRDWTTILESNCLDLTLSSSTFVPLAVTALGVWDERSLLWLKKFSGISQLLPEK